MQTESPFAKFNARQKFPHYTVLCFEGFLLIKYVSGADPQFPEALLQAKGA